ncbi:hypothetical protein CLV84_1922 [Neolewinella xylanilytica]|uniref:Lipoprotein n=1 Tax=Neolewinella xylanilytica TaxID=1514080 RepID=A0A2S6I1L2_9BACT|nr:hypothetical protein [Neolewinella xylanilytica]PPK85033.1 hypothetical protein CLV84_1922 [Neolewinella xylanilytica]
MKTIFSLFFALMLFACGERPAATEEMDTVETDEMETTMPDMQNPIEATAPSQTLDATVSAVESAGGDITALDPSTAVSNIDSWISELGTMDGTDEIVSDLQDLKTQLTAETIDGSAVSELLSSLAEETRELGGDNMGLSTLASALEAGAEKLGGM